MKDSRLNHYNKLNQVKCRNSEFPYNEFSSDKLKRVNALINKEKRKPKTNDDGDNDKKINGGSEGNVIRFFFI